MTSVPVSVHSVTSSTVILVVMTKSLATKNNGGLWDPLTRLPVTLLRGSFSGGWQETAAYHKWRTDRKVISLSFTALVSPSPFFFQYWLIVTPYREPLLLKFSNNMFRANPLPPG